MHQKMDPVTTSLYKVIKTLSSLLEKEREEFNNLKTQYDSLLAEKEKHSLSVISHTPAVVPQHSTSDKKALLNMYINENLTINKESTKPIIVKELKNIWRDWKRSMGRLIDIRESEVIEFLKSFDARSTDKEIYGFVINELHIETTA